MTSNDDFFMDSGGGGFDDFNTGAATMSPLANTAPSVTLRPPSWILFLSIALAIGAIALTFFAGQSFMWRLLSWLIATVAITAISLYLMQDTKLRGRTGYAEYASDVWVFRAAVILGIIAVIVTAAFWGLTVGR